MTSIQTTKRSRAAPPQGPRKQIPFNTWLYSSEEAECKEIPATRLDTHNGMIFGRTSPDCNTLLFGGHVELSFCLLGSEIGPVLMEN